MARRRVATHCGGANADATVQFSPLWPVLKSPICLADNGVSKALRKASGKTVMEMQEPRIPARTGNQAEFHGELSRQALDHLFSVTYEELRRLASTLRRNDPGATLNSTALVNEAWIKLEKSREFGYLSPLHFKRIAARAMRQLLVESARRRHAEKRGGNGVVLVAFNDAAGAGMGTASAGTANIGTASEMLALDEALDRLAALNPRQAAIVETRYFGGLEVAETAALLEISEATVHREWRVARAWLSAEIRCKG